MANPPISDKTDLITFEIKVNSKVLDSSYPILYIEVNKAVNKIPSARVILSDGSADIADFPISNENVLIPGGKIEVLAGYHGVNELIFKGIIVKHGIRIRESGSATLNIECRDESVKMTVGRKNALFQKKKDSDIIKELANNYSLQSEVDTTDYEHPELVQYYSSDWDFMVLRADINGLLVISDDGKISVKKPDTSSKPDIKVQYGFTILDLEAEIDSRTQLKKVKSNAWDMSQQKIIDQPQGSESYKTPGNLDTNTLAKTIDLSEYELQTPANVNNESLKSWSSSKMMRSQLSKIRGSVRFQGNALVKPGKTLELGGIGKRFNGNAFVGKTTNIISEGNWTTTASFGLAFENYADDTPDIFSFPTAGLTPPMRGLQTGKVLKIHEDPDGEFRVKVNIPLLNSAQEGIWARLATFYANNKTGAFFYPEIGDEVVVGFLDENSGYPIILGSLYSSKLPPPISPEDKNPKKVIVTREKLELVLNDQDKIIEIKTPAKNQVVFDDKEGKVTLSDQNKNVIEMSSSGIKISSEGDISIEAKGNISSKADGDISNKANGNISSKGADISNDANGTFSANGTMGEVNGKSQLTLKGGMVMIN